MKTLTDLFMLSSKCVKRELVLAYFLLWRHKFSMWRHKLWHAKRRNQSCFPVAANLSLMEKYDSVLLFEVRIRPKSISTWCNTELLVRKYQDFFRIPVCVTWFFRSSSYIKKCIRVEYQCRTRACLNFMKCFSKVTLI
jgi:hypothetical protein